MNSQGAPDQVANDDRLALLLRQALVAAANQPNQEQSLNPTGITEALQQSCVEGGNKIGSLRDVQVERVTNPERGPSFDFRHNQLLTRDALVEVLASNDSERIRALEDEIAESGGFLLEYNGVGTERLNNAFDFNDPARGGWIMLETSAIPLDKNGAPLTSGKVLGADGQFYIPPDSDDASPEHFPLLEAGRDVIMNGLVISEGIKTHPAEAMCIADISAVREYSRFGFAAVTEDAAFYLLQEINGLRQHTIKYVVAAIASVKGVMDNEGALLAPALDGSGLSNLRSLNLHINRRNARGFLHGKQSGRRVPVNLPDKTPGSLIVDWFVTVQEVKKMTPPQNLYIFGKNMN